MSDDTFRFARVETNCENCGESTHFDLSEDVVSRAQEKSAFGGGPCTCGADLWVEIPDDPEIREREIAQ